VTDRYEARIAPQVPTDVPLFVIPHDRINTLVGFHYHQGVLACAKRGAWPALEPFVSRLGTRAVLVLCPELDNPENLGAIVRLSDVFGADAVLVGSRGCPDPLSRRVLRVSMGTALRVPVIAVDDLESASDRLHADWAFQRYATVTDPTAEPLPALCRPDRLALVLGGEADGLSSSWTSRCERRVTIPMRAGAESLNVALAASILLYALMGGASCECRTLK
jgi:tRNA G18 (ribose-2'-O)-methylase SpoU